MKRTLIFLLLTTLLLGLAGCRFNYMEPEAMEQFLDGIAENIGDSQITNDENLIGKRTLKLSNGGNYMMVVYEDFTGSIEMNCEYVPQDDIYAE